MSTLARPKHAPLGDCHCHRQVVEVMQVYTNGHQEPTLPTTGIGQPSTNT